MTVHNAPVNVKSGAGIPGICGSFDLYCPFPTLGNLTKNLGPRVGTFAFLRGGIRPSQVIPFARLCAARL